MKPAHLRPSRTGNVSEQILTHTEREEAKSIALLKKVYSDLVEAAEPAAAKVLDEILADETALKKLLEALSHSEWRSRHRWKRLKDFEQFAKEAREIAEHLRKIHCEVLKAHIEVQSVVDPAIHEDNLGPFSPERVLLKGGWPLIDAADKYADAIWAMARTVAKKGKSEKDGGGPTSTTSPGAKANQTPREILAIGIAKAWDTVEADQPYRRGTVPTFVALLRHIHKRLLGDPPGYKALKEDVTFARRR